MAAKPFQIGYVGVGLMGLPMVHRLLKLGWNVRAYDIVPQQVAASGVQPADSAAATASDVVLLNLPTQRCRQGRRVRNSRPGAQHAGAAAPGRFLDHSG